MIFFMPKTLNFLNFFSLASLPIHYKHILIEIGQKHAKKGLISQMLTLSMIFLPHCINVKQSCINNDKELRSARLKDIIEDANCAIKL